MTKLYFVRHAQPDYRQGVNNTFALSEEGMKDRMKAFEALSDIRFDAAVSSPYRRSLDTIEPIVSAQGLTVKTDIRLRERDNPGGNSNTHEMFRKRWADFSFHEEGGESLGSTQKRNVAAVFDMLNEYKDKTVLVGTHGTALSTIINYFEPSFLCEQFFRIINFMPYVIRLDFDGEKYLGKEELTYVQKEFHGVK